MDEHLSPADASVALRSFPRRFRAMLQPPVDVERFDPDELARRPASTGWTAVDHLVAAEGLMSLLWHALGERRHGGELPAGLADPTGQRWPDDGSTLPSLLDAFADTAEACAQRIADVPRDDWAEPTVIEDQVVSNTWLHLVQSVVDAVAGHLRAGQAVLDEVR